MKEIKVKKKGFNSVESIKNSCSCKCSCETEPGSSNNYVDTLNRAYDHSISPDKI